MSLSFMCVRRKQKMTHKTRTTDCTGLSYHDAAWDWIVVAASFAAKSG